MTTPGRPGSDQVAVQRRPVAELRLWDRNPRRHDERSVQAIGKSLARYGQQKPVVIRPDGTVLAGNGTVAAAHALGWTDVEVVVFDGTESQAAAYSIADNRTAELSRWFYEAVAQELRALEGDDLDALGWTVDEREVLLAAAWPASAPLEGHVRQGKRVRIPMTDEQRAVVQRAVDRMSASLGVRPTRTQTGVSLVLIAQGLR